MTLSSTTSPSHEWQKNGDRYARLTENFCATARQIALRTGKPMPEMTFYVGAEQTQALLRELAKSTFGRDCAAFHRQNQIVTLYVDDKRQPGGMNGMYDDDSRGVVIAANRHASTRECALTLGHEIIHGEQTKVFGPINRFGGRGRAVDIGYRILREASALAGETILTAELKAADQGRQVAPQEFFPLAREVFLNVTTNKEWTQYAMNNAMTAEDFAALRPSPLHFICSALGSKHVRQYARANGGNYLRAADLW